MFDVESPRTERPRTGFHFDSAIGCLHNRLSGEQAVSPMLRGKRKRTKAQISFNMSRVKNTGSEIERVMEKALVHAKLRPTKHLKILGRPDFAFPRAMVAVFCDSHFWHGYNWKIKKKEIRSNRSFWLPKIFRNMRRDRFVNRCLREEGWTVLRFWEHQILRSPDECAARVKNAITTRRNGI